MKYAVDRVVHEQESGTITIFISEDIRLVLSLDNEGYLVINKSNFGSGDGALQIVPSVSNQIKIK